MMIITIIIQGEECWLPVLHQPLTGYITLGKLINISKTHFPHLQCGENNSICTSQAITVRVK